MYGITVNKRRTLLQPCLNQLFKTPRLVRLLRLFFSTSSMVLLCALSGLSLRFQRCDLWLRPPSSSLSVVSCRATRGRLRLRELIRWREPGSWSLNRSGQGHKVRELQGKSYVQRDTACEYARGCERLSTSNLQSVSSISASASLSP